MTSKSELESKYPGISLDGEPNPDFSDEYWYCISQIASIMAHCFQEKNKSVRAIASVYCLQRGSQDVFKIGMTTNIEKRIKRLQTGCAEELKIIKCVETKDAKEIEQSLLKSLSKYRKKGEWLECNKMTILKAFKEVCH